MIQGMKIRNRNHNLRAYRMKMCRQIIGSRFENSFTCPTDFNIMNHRWRVNRSFHKIFLNKKNLKNKFF